MAHLELLEIARKALKVVENWRCQQKFSLLYILLCVLWKQQARESQKLSQLHFIVQIRKKKSIKIVKGMTSTCCVLFRAVCLHWVFPFSPTILPISSGQFCTENQKYLEQKSSWKSAKTWIVLYEELNVAAVVAASISCQKYNWTSLFGELDPCCADNFRTRWTLSFQEIKWNIMKSEHVVKSSKELKYGAFKKAQTREFKAEHFGQQWYAMKIYDYALALNILLGFLFLLPGLSTAR